MGRDVYPRCGQAKAWAAGATIRRAQGLQPRTLFHRARSPPDANNAGTLTPAQAILPFLVPGSA
jgi:hypothetical protein